MFIKAQSSSSNWIIFLACSLSTNDFSPIYPTLPHTLIKENRSVFQRILVVRGSSKKFCNYGWILPEAFYEKNISNTMLQSIPPLYRNTFLRLLYPVVECI